MAARKTSKAPTRVWKFGALAPTANADLVQEQMDLANEYYVQLIEIHRDRWFGQRRILREHCPEFARLDDKCRELNEQISAVYEKTRAERQEHYRKTGKKALLPPDDREQVEALKAEVKRVSKERSAALKAHYKAHAEVQADFKRLVEARSPNNHTRAAIKSEVLDAMPAADPSWLADRRVEEACVAKLKEKRAACGLSFGTYLQTEDAANKAAKDRMEMGQPARVDPDKTRPSKIAVQIAKRSNGTFFTWGDILSGGSKFFQLRSANGSKPDEYYVARIRVGSETNKAPIWAEFPVRIHRHPPKDAVVKWAWVVIRKQGERKRYELQVTLEHMAFSEPKRPAGVGKGEHIRIGWSAREDGALIATGPWDVLVSASLIDQAEHAAAIRSHADQHFNEARVAVGEKPVTQFSEKERIAFRDDCVQYAKQMFPSLKTIWHWWKNERLAAEKDLFCFREVSDEWLDKYGTTAEQKRVWYLYLWARKDMHLRQYAADVYKKFERRRDAFFKSEAIRIATAFETITIDSYNIANLKQLPDLKTSENRPSEKAQARLQHAAPGRFREVLLETMGSRCTPCERPGGDKTTATTRKAKNTKKGTRKTKKPHTSEPQAAE